MKQLPITPVILAGGNGTRLWPLSREAVPKQFCNLIGEESLFQRAVRRSANPNLFHPPIIVCNAAHRSIVSRQLADINVTPEAVICEPCGRDTAAAILLATEVSTRADDALYLIMPSDHEIQDTTGFEIVIEKAARIAAGNQKIVTFGITPTHPETGYGYLRTISCRDGSSYLELSSFIEKPSLNKAEELIQEPGIFWNAGIFLLSKHMARQEAEAHVPAIIKLIKLAVENGDWENGRFLPDEAFFSRITKISFDYAIMEKTPHAAVMPLEQAWSDLGSWDAIWQCSRQDQSGNTSQGPVYAVDTDCSLIHSEGPVVGVAGLRDVVVIADNDAVLVTSREQSQSVKKLVEKMKEDACPAIQSHRGEDRPWGRFDSIDRGEGFQVKRIRVNPSGQLSLQYHHHRAEHWVVVKGVATVTVDDRVMQLGPCQQVFIPQGAVHRLENFGDEPVELIEVQYGHYLGEDDIIRLEDVYGRNSPEDDQSITNAA